MRFFIVLVMFALAACGSNPPFTDTTEAKGPSTFMNYSEQLGRSTSGFNPCVTGVADSDTDFAAETSTSASRRDGLNTDQRTYTRKAGTCN